MSRFACTLGFGLVLAVGLGFLVGPYAMGADDDEKAIKEAQKDLLDLARTLESGKEDAAKLQAIKKKYEDLAPIMHAYKPSPKGGIGVGPKGAGDGIELKLQNMGKRKLSPVNAGKEKADLLKMAYLNLAIAHVTEQYPPPKKPGKSVKEWKQYLDDMKKASKELAGAAKAADPMKLQAAATNMNNACNNCHSDFRD